MLPHSSSPASRPRRPRARTLLAGLALAAAGLALSACGPQQAGAAAIVGGERISTESVRADLDEIAVLAEESGQQLTDEQRGQLSGEVLRQRILYVIGDTTAEQAGLEFSQGELDAQLESMGGAEQLAAQGVLPAHQDSVVRFELLVQRLGEQASEQELAAVVEQLRPQAEAQLLPQLQQMYGDQQELIDAEINRQLEGQARQQVALQAVQTAAQEISVDVNPRYGTFDPATLSINPEWNAVSAPEESGQPTVPGMGGVIPPDGG
ncbi:hypothetical protein [Allonocardiopsis opalescens]|uniref:SurA-like protein n=1 Tax=Allonocardiopsis opalescens TaxID=1144618 RepID=A0A2T0QD71_9ACTN|nr:hypothetical protein [Allonocardiopsis opalescens]PRY01855.1 hypothetical protein CLV72_101452 [Allonocardiopsis opalescens]